MYAFNDAFSSAEVLLKLLILASLVTTAALVADFDDSDRLGEMSNENLDSTVLILI